MPRQGVKNTTWLNTTFWKDFLTTHLNVLYLYLFFYFLFVNVSKTALWHTLRSVQSLESSVGPLPAQQA